MGMYHCFSGPKNASTHKGALDLILLMTPKCCLGRKKSIIIKMKSKNSVLDPLDLLLSQSGVVDSVGLLQWLRFPSTEQHESPNLSIEPRMS